MNHRLKITQDFLSKKLGYLLNPKNLLKVFYKPHRIGTFIREQVAEINTKFSDIKLLTPSDSQLLGIEKASVQALARLAARSAHTPFAVKTIDAVFGPGTETDPESLALAALFNQYGSDKATTHDYYRVYAALLKQKHGMPLHILEIGLGTNNVDIPSNMGTYGKPGASVRAFRDRFPGALVFGADIDTRILFEETRIKTAYVDQTRPETYDALMDTLGKELQFDLIIDDGLHNSEANLNTLNFALSRLKPNGVFVVEDININDAVYYQVVARLLEPGHTVDFLQTRSGCMCIISAKA